jgi:hypothetical protein
MKNRLFNVTFVGLGGKHLLIEWQTVQRVLFETCQFTIGLQ